MSRILAIDYGQKRVGLAVSDPLQIIASRLDTVPAGQIWRYLSEYFGREKVERVLVGYPTKLNNMPSEALIYINPFIREFVRKYPDMKLELVDERFTSRIAQRAMIEGGVRKSKRQDKALVDGISAVIILQSWMEQNKMKSTSRHFPPA